MPGGRLRVAMKIQTVILRAMAKRITWRPVAEIIRISDRSLRRWLGHCEQSGCAGLFDRRPLDQARSVLLVWRRVIGPGGCSGLWCKGSKRRWDNPARNRKWKGSLGDEGVYTRSRCKTKMMEIPDRSLACR